LEKNYSVLLQAKIGILMAKDQQTCYTHFNWLFAGFYNRHYVYNYFLSYLICCIVYEHV